MLASREPLAGLKPLAGLDSSGVQPAPASNLPMILGGLAPLASVSLAVATSPTTVHIVAVDSWAFSQIATTEIAVAPILVSAADGFRWSDGLKPDDAPQPTGGGGGSPAVEDTFTGTAGTILSSHTADSGGTWTQPTTLPYGPSAVLTAAGRARWKGTGFSSETAYYWSVVPSSADYDVAASVHVATAVGKAGVMARMATNSNRFIALRYDASTGSLDIDEYSDTQQATLATVSLGWAVGSTHAIRLSVSGSQASGYVDGSLVLGPVTVTQAAIGRPAVYFGAPSASTPSDDSSLVQLDDFGTGTAAVTPPAVVYGISPETVGPLAQDAATLADSRWRSAATLSASDAPRLVDSAGLTATIGRGDGFGLADAAFVVVIGPTTLEISDGDGFRWSAVPRIDAGFIGLDSFAYLDAFANPSYLISATEAVGFLESALDLSASVAGLESFAWRSSVALSAAIGGGDRFTTGDGGTPLELKATQIRLGFDRIAFAEAAAVAIGVGDLDAFGFFDRSAASVGVSSRDSAWAFSDMAIAGLAPFAVAAMDAAGFVERSSLAGSPVGMDALGWLASEAIGVGVHSLDAFAEAEWSAVFLTVTALDAFGLADSGSVRPFTSTLVYNVYANSGDGGPIDYSSAVAVVDGLSWTSESLAAGSDNWFGVRAYSVATGLEEKNIDAAVRVLIDADRRDVTARPSPPTSIRAVPLAGGKVRVEWSDRKPAGTVRATGYRVYQGVGVVDWTTPVADVPASQGLAASFSTVVGPLTHGVTYAFGVRAYNASAEETNTAQATATADAEGPAAVGGFAIGLTSES